MRIMVVDDSRLAAMGLARMLAKVDAQATCEVALSAQEALALCEKNPVDVAFLDVEMPGTNGLTLARRLAELSPKTNVVFVTAYPEYALDAWDVKASDFLVKPASEVDVRHALQQLRHPVENQEPHPRLYVQCFGNFQLFYDGVPVPFERSHTKELLAYLVDRHGALVSMGELLGVFWEDQPDTVSRRSQLRNYISELRRTFAELGRPDAIVRRRGGVAVSLAPEECDYYSYLEGLPQAAHRYRGEYMCQYSWAEVTAALLASRG